VVLEGDDGQADLLSMLSAGNHRWVNGDTIFAGRCLHFRLFFLGLLSGLCEPNQR
jgi:hypothetical protein